MTLDAAHQLGCFKGVCLGALFQVTGALVFGDALSSCCAFNLDGEEKKVEYHIKSPPLKVIGKKWVLFDAEKTANDGLRSLRKLNE
jgi:hypothetical protein